MATLGNILLIIASLIYFGLLNALYGKIPPRSGDAVIGYFWGLVFFNLAFFACMVIASVAIAYKDGFDWISPNKSSRYLWVVLLLIITTTGSALSGFFKYEQGRVSSVIRVTSSFAPALIPLILILTGILMLNSNLRLSVDVNIYKWPLILAGILSFVIISTLVIDYISASFRNQMAQMESAIQEKEENNIRMMKDIDSIDAVKSMANLLVFTDGNKDPEVKNKAVSRVKTNPEWQQELVRLLESVDAPDAFTFLASNPVDSTDLFLDPVRNGILEQANLIREDIRKGYHTSHFYPEQYSWEVERVLRTVEKFKGKGVDYLPAMKELRKALDEPSEFKEITFSCIHPLDRWISENK